MRCIEQDFVLAIVPPNYSSSMSSRAQPTPATRSPEEWLEKVAPEKVQGTFKLVPVKASTTK